MSRQSEHALEENLLVRLQELGYSYVKITNEAGLLANLKTQLELHNNIKFTENEFARVLNHLNKGAIFDRAEILRDKMHLPLDNGDSTYIEFIQQEHWCRNRYQVTNQVSMEGTYKNRYDVTILVNGFPLAQIELKRHGLELKEAFRQIKRYGTHSFGASYGLFLYTQIFVISNGVNTKYFANNKKLTFEQTFYWTDIDNKPITNLDKFADIFLEPCHLSKMITRYIVLHQSDKILMVMRPYQYYAVEALIERVKTTRKNGYIWHTTGSGKTLTSFKASLLLVRQTLVDKVVFVVDRKDLDYQTQKEFNAFSKGSVDSTGNTNILVRQFTDDTKLIITTIQKLNNAIEKEVYKARMSGESGKNIVFIFDECHRSQFGETHKHIRKFFINARMFGFTGTPIFAENAISVDQEKHTTRELFDDCLHKYVITDAIRDENVLRFSIEYMGRYREKDGRSPELDIEVEDIDTGELLNSYQRLEKIVDNIIRSFDRKTHGKEFNAIFCVSSIKTLVKYYEIFRYKKEKGEHNLRVGTIFSYVDNEEPHMENSYESYRDDFMVSEKGEPYGQTGFYFRDKLEDFIGDYNRMFNARYTTRDTRDFYSYYNDISNRVKKKELDILLVVNMFLTGFDSPRLSTLFVDKNLKYHGLIQAFSRTNRIYNELKTQGNIVCYRNLKKATDDAVALFSNKEANEIIFLAPYEEYVEKLNAGFEYLLSITPTPDAVDLLVTDEQKLEFIKAFREIIRLLTAIKTFVEFEWEHLAIDEELYYKFQTKYLDLRPSSPTREKVSILNDVDFEVELLHRDEITVSYILKLLFRYKQMQGDERDKQLQSIFDLLGGELELRSKRELIKKFIEENLPYIPEDVDITDEFEEFWNRERQAGFEAIIKEESLNREKFRYILENYLFTNTLPLGEEIIETIEGEKPGIITRKKVAERIVEKLVNFVETFVKGMDEG